MATPAAPILLAMPGLFGPSHQRIRASAAISLDPDYPAVTDVVDGVSYGNGGYTGDVVLPAETDVKSGVGYGSGGTEYTGSMSGGGGNRCF